MGLPKGTNNGAHGKKGRSGRKSFYEESNLAEIVKKAFEEGYDYTKFKQLLEDINSGKATKIKLIDVALAKSIKSERILSELLRKVLPDKIEHSGGIEQRVTKIDYVVPKKPEQPKTENNFDNEN